MGRSRRPAVGMGVLSHSVVEMTVPWTGVMPAAVERSGQMKAFWRQTADMMCHVHRR